MESAAEFTAHYLKETWGDEERPRYLEVLNEPMVKLKNIGGTPTDVAKLHVAVAKRVRKLCPNALIGGYTAAYPEVETFPRHPQRPTTTSFPISVNGSSVSAGTAPRV